jgi:hypothetical protein
MSHQAHAPIVALHESQTGEPYSGSEIVAALERLHEESQRYIEALPISVFIQPQGQKWSPADHVRHLSKSTYPLVRALGLPKLVVGALFGRNAGASRAFPVIREVYRARLQAGATAGRFAPSPRPVPADPEPWRAQVLGSWRSAASALHAGARSWNEAALDRYRLPHPALGRLTVREMLLFTLYHNAHHLNLVASRIGAA